MIFTKEKFLGFSSNIPKGKGFQSPLENIKDADKKFDDIFDNADYRKLPKTRELIEKIKRIRRD